MRGQQTSFHTLENSVSAIDLEQAYRSYQPTSGVCYIPFLQHLEPKMPSKERLPRIWEKPECTTVIALLTYIDPIQSFPPHH